MFAEGKVKKFDINPNDKRKSDLLKIMPDYDAIITMGGILHRYEKLPVENRMPIFPGEPYHINCKPGRFNGAGSF